MEKSHKPRTYIIGPLGGYDRGIPVFTSKNPAPDLIHEMPADDGASFDTRAMPDEETPGETPTTP